MSAAARPIAMTRFGIRRQVRSVLAVTIASAITHAGIGWGGSNMTCLDPVLLRLCKRRRDAGRDALIEIVHGAAQRSDRAEDRHRDERPDQRILDRSHAAVVPHQLLHKRAPCMHGDLPNWLVA